MTVDPTVLFRTVPVKTAVETDNGPGKWRIGLIVLSNDYAIERDFINMRPGDDVAIFVTRIANANACRVDMLQAMAPRITAATELLVPDGRLDSVAYACTSGTVVIGYNSIQERAQSRAFSDQFGS